MPKINKISYVSFYAKRGNDLNYHYTFKVHSITAGYKLLKKFERVRAAYYVVKFHGVIFLNQRM